MSIMPTFAFMSAHVPRSRCSRQADGSSHRSDTSRTKRITAEISASDKSIDIPLFSGIVPNFARNYPAEMDLFSDDIRRNPYPIYAQIRALSPIFKIPPPFDAWGIFDYDGVKRALSDHENFSSRVPAPPNWFIFFDPPRHTKLRAIISKAFTPRIISGLDNFIRTLSRQLLDEAISHGKDQFDVATQYSIPLPMKVISHMIGIPGSDWAQFKTWSDTILKMSYARGGKKEENDRILNDFISVSIVMNDYLSTMIAKRQKNPTDDLLTKLMDAEVDGQHLTQEEILGFFQLLVV